MNLNEVDILHLNPLKLKYIGPLGGYFYLNRIENFTPGIPTQCEFVRVNEII